MMYAMAFSDLANGAEETTDFGSVLMYGTIDLEDGTVRKAEEGENPDMWSTYGRDHSGLVEWVADFSREIHCLLFTSTLAAVLGVPVEGGDLSHGPIASAAHLLNHKGATN